MSLIALLGKHYPGVRAHCIGDDTVYSNLVWDGGDPLPTEQELQNIALTDVKGIKIKQLSDTCAQAILDGFISSALGSPFKYDAEDVDQINILGAVTATLPSAENPTGTSMMYAVRPVVNGVYGAKYYTEHTHAQLKQVLIDGATYKLERLQHFNTLRDEVNTATTVEEINAISW